MGHAGAFTLPGEHPASAKVQALEAAGVAVVNHPSRFGPVLKTLLSNPTAARPRGISPQPNSQQRQIHTMLCRPIPESRAVGSTALTQKRNIYIPQDAALGLLRHNRIGVRDPEPSEAQRILAISVNRGSSKPCVIAAPGTDVARARRFDFDYGDEAKNLPVSDICRYLDIGENAASSLQGVLDGLIHLFMLKEAFLIETRVVESAGAVEVAAARFGFDNAAFKSCGRHGDIQQLRDTSAKDPTEVEAEKYGIVYIKLDGNIGTLGNGAGLAMNTVDALADAGGHAANFLDTGGKATSETVKKSFEAILSNPEVKVSPVGVRGLLTTPPLPPRKKTPLRYLKYNNAIHTVYPSEHLRRFDIGRYDCSWHRTRI